MFKGEVITSEELIECPECKTVQWASIKENPDFPFASYIHDCQDCGYTIMESEWNEVGSEKIQALIQELNTLSSPDLVIRRLVKEVNLLTGMYGKSGALASTVNDESSGVILGKFCEYIAPAEASA